MRVGIITLGCDKNTVDNEYLAGLLERGGCELIAHDAEGRAVTLDGAPASGPLDAIVVTTCGFIDAAKQQSIDAIVEMAERKKNSGDPRRLFVAGCLSQRYGADLLKEIPEIDGIVGVGQFARLAEMILAADARASAAAGPQSAIAKTPGVDIDPQLQRRRLDRSPHAFLKISDGCNHACSFCSIPIMKGRLRSVPPQIVLDEARRLVAGGVKEINLVAQDLSMYGMDGGARPELADWRLPRLLRDLCAIEGDFWIRCLYDYPGLVTDDFLAALAEQPKIVKYLDMPLQHLDEETLRRMKRPYAAVNTSRLVERLRAAVPGLTLRTTMIVGFPGETPEAHARMLQLIDELEFDRLGAFQYSREEDTPAAKMKGQVPKRERQRRWKAVMAAQARVSERLNARRVGRRERALVESFDAPSGLWQARGQAEAPEIDGKILLRGDALRPGQFADVEITSAGVYDVEARAL